MKYKKYILGLATMGLFSACTDLTPEIYSNLTTANAYSTEADIDAAVVGLYSDMNPYPGDSWLYYGGYMVMITDYATDMGYSTAAGDPTKLSTMTYDASNRYFSNNWRDMYNVISNANTILDNVDAVDMSEENKKLVKGQAKFLRALAYRDLTDAWGAVPFITTLTKNPFDMNDMPLTPVSVIEETLISDLKECIDLLPKSWTGTDLARATSGAAATLLGKIYLRNHDYTNAKTYIDMVLESGQYELEDDFKYVWSEQNKYGKEMIFALLHETGSNAAEIACHFGPSDNPEVPGRWQYYGVSLPFWRTYDKKDPRREFFYYDYTGDAKRDDQSNYGFRYMVPDEGVTVVPNDTTKFMQNVATKKYTYQMASDAYYDGRTICIFRLADVILCKAEIENNIAGGTPSAALPYLNKIRHRAGAPEYGEDPDFPAPTTKEAMNDAILKERGWELVFEFQRRADLIRFGKYAEVVNKYLGKLGISKPTTVTEDLRYFPYPQNDAQLNVNMAKENPSRLPK